MIINYNLKKLQRVLDDFCHVTGIRISLCDAKGGAVTRSAKQDDFCQLWQEVCGEARCRACDAQLFRESLGTGKPSLHRCHNGLLDMCVPVLSEGTLLAYLIMGRIRTSPEMPKSLCARLPAEHHARAQELYRDLPLYSVQNAERAANLAAILASYILAENLILTQKSEEAERLIAYIDAHLAEELDATRLCRDMHVSRTMLYRLFERHMGCGVGQYVCARRMEVARELLARTDLPVREVGERIGIPNYTYFCRLFKKINGISPLQYRKNATV
jgi:AraC-like DNA-binding protein